MKSKPKHVNVNNVTGKKPVDKVPLIMIAAILAGIYFWLCCRVAYLNQEQGGAITIFQIIEATSSQGKWTDILVNAASLKFFFGTSAVIVVVVYAYYLVEKSKEHFPDEKVHGVEHFMTEKEIKEFNKEFNEPLGKPYPESEKNTILAKNVEYAMNTDITGTNNNMLIIGGPGSGKSFGIVKPNLLQGYGSYVVTDPSGELLESTGKFFASRDYEIKVFNLVDMDHSNCYNPFNYIHEDKDVITLIDSLIDNTEHEGQKGGDPFWRESMSALYQSLVFYLRKYAPKEKQNFAEVSNMLRLARIDPSNGGKATKTQLDAMFDKVREKHPNDICVKQYDIFKQAGDKTAQSILITAAVKLSPFNIQSVANLTNTDDIDITTIGDRPTILYIIVPQGANSYAFLVNMLYTQLFDSCYFHATNDCEGLRLKHDVRFMLDEFRNIGKIPGFTEKLTTMRKYGMSCMIFIQAIAQIKDCYGDDWETIVGACDTMVYLGGNELSTMEDLVKKIGKTTIKTRSTGSSSSAKGGNSSRNYSYSEKEVISVSELRRLEKGYCIVIIKGHFPFYEEKYNPFNHVNAPLMGNPRDGTNLYHFTKSTIRTKPFSEHSDIKRKEENKIIKEAAEGKTEAPIETVKTIESGEIASFDDVFGENGSLGSMQTLEFMRAISTAAIANNTQTTYENGGTTKYVESNGQSKKETEARVAKKNVNAKISM